MIATIKHTDTGENTDIRQGHRPEGKKHLPRRQFKSRLSPCLLTTLLFLLCCLACISSPSRNWVLTAAQYARLMKDNSAIQLFTLVRPAHCASNVRNNPGGGEASVANIHSSIIGVSQGDFLAATSAAGLAIRNLSAIESTHPVEQAVVTASQISFYPRPKFAYRMRGGKFQVSQDNVSYTDVYTLGNAPPEGVWTTVQVGVDLSQYRYLRYLSASGGYGNVADVRFYSGLGAGAVLLSGFPFGPSGPLQHSDRLPANAFDGNINTFNEYSAPGPQYVGIDRSAPAVAPVQLPIEVMGADGTVASVQVALPDTAKPCYLLMVAHNLSYPDKASVQINSSAWMPLDNSTVQVAKPEKQYGGIGGGFSTVRILLTLPPNSTQPGTDTISFRFNHTDGVSSGFRILRFNLLDAIGQSILPADAFVQDDPGTWKPTLTAASDIAAGQALWKHGQLLRSTLVPSPIRATCADCHTDDGRDLKYFNYSNYSIIERAQFHGLSQTQGAQIASYIRSLPVINPGRPWNPPYQPGPGLDSKPVQEWAAGAGLEAVLNSSVAMLPYVFPSTGGIPNAGDIAASTNLDMRELPINIELPDWNHWLPVVWPGDIPGAGFSNSLALGRYNGNVPGYRGTTVLSAATKVQANPTPANLRSLATNYLPAWLGEVRAFALTHAVNPSENATGSGIGPGSIPLTWDTSTATYSVALWGRVKEWGVMQTYGLENMGQMLYGPTTRNGLPIENRVWFTGATFLTAPGFLGVYGNVSGKAAADQFAALSPPDLNIDQNPFSLSPLVPGTPQVYELLRVDWYWLQLILNAGDYNRYGNNPVDWGYLPSAVAGLGNWDRTDTGMMSYATHVKMIQQLNNGVMPDQASPYVQGWDIRVSNPAPMLDLTDPDLPYWGKTPTPTKTALISAYLAAWLTVAEQYTPAQYYAQGAVDQQFIRQDETTAQVSQGYFRSPDAGQDLYHSVPILDTMGVEPTLMNNYVSWLQNVMPNVDFNGDR